MQETMHLLRSPANAAPSAQINRHCRCRKIESAGPVAEVNLFWTDIAWEDLPLLAGERSKLVEKINALLKDLRRTPFQGLGKPEPLRGSLTGWWSRRITGDHRLIYRVRGKGCEQLVETRPVATIIDALREKIDRLILVSFRLPVKIMIQQRA